MWALGILTYELLFLVTPFYSENPKEMFRKILNDVPKFPPNVPDDVSTFILALLTKDYRQRPSFEQIKVMSFFQGMNFSTVLDGTIKPKYIQGVPKKMGPPKKASKSNILKNYLLS